MTMSSRHRSKLKNEGTRHEDDFELVQSLSQPYIRQLLDLLSTDVLPLVRNAKHELDEERPPNIETDGVKHLKRDLKDAQNRIEELEAKLLQKDKGLNSYKPTVTNLEKRLDFEKRSKVEFEKKFQEASKLAEKLKKEVQSAENETRRARTELKNREEELKKTKIELDDARTRLSRSMGDKLTDNNPNIADLSDKNRPTKLAERYQEIYDNEWTDAFETIQQRSEGDEDKTTSVLISILMDTMKFCEEEACLQMNEIQKTVTKRSSSVSSGIPQNVKKQLKDCRKAVAEVSAKYFYQKYNTKLQSSASSTARTARMVPEFVEACFCICWLSTVQDPPIVLGPNVNRGDPFNTEVYKAYTRSGKRVEFVVWPALLLHEDGPVLCKGIAQGYGDLSRRSKSAPPKDRKQDISSGRSPGSYSATVKPVKVKSPDSFYARDTRGNRYAIGSQERRTYARKYDDEEEEEEEEEDMTPVTSYHQTVHRQSRGMYKPKNLYQYENDSSSRPDPSESDVDTFLRWRERFGHAEAKRLMGKDYDICLRYLQRLHIL